MRSWRLPLWNTDSISGVESVPCSSANLPKTARPGGTSGSTPPSRRPSGLARRKKSCCISLKYSLVNGGQLPRLSVAVQPASALSSMRGYSIEHRERLRRTPTTPAICAPAKSIQTPKLNPADRTPSTWTTTKRSNYRSAELGYKIPRERRPRGKKERSIWKKQGDLHICKRWGSCRQRGLQYIRSSTIKRGQLTTAPRFLSKEKCLLVASSQMTQKHLKKTSLGRTSLFNKSSRSAETMRKRPRGPKMPKGSDSLRRRIFPRLLKRSIRPSIRMTSNCLSNFRGALNSSCVSPSSRTRSSMTFRNLHKTD